MIRTVFALCIASISVMNVPAAAQASRFSVSGQVVDATGLALVGASVTLRRPSAGFERTTVTNSAGRYLFLNIPDGTYSVSGTLHGFSVAERAVTVWRDAVTVNLTLQPGSFAEEISVVGARLVGSEEMLRRIPGSVDVLTSDVLESSHVFTTSEAMRKVPGLQVRDEEGQIGRASCRKGVDLGGRRSSKKKKDKGISYINVGN